MVIDGYAHCGISKYKPVHAVVDLMQKTGVDRTLLCQHLGEYDNSYLAQVVADHPRRFAAVCLIDPGADDPVSALNRWHATGRFRGARVLAEWIEPHFSLWRHALTLGLHLMLFAPNGVGEAAPAIRQLLAECPGGKIIVSHLGNPTVSNGALTAGAGIHELSEAPGIYVLLSGLSMFCEYPHTALRPLVLDLIDRFGPGRVMWGSNFPVCGEIEDYVRDLKLVLAGHWVEAPEQIHQIAGDTANRVWFGENL